MDLRGGRYETTHYYRSGKIQNVLFCHDSRHPPSLLVININICQDLPQLTIGNEPIFKTYLLTPADTGEPLLLISMTWIGCIDGVGILSYLTH